jgi:SPP1 gp7 family putative phage head morphogenesis protein
MRGRLLEDRLSNIARTESARAQNYGFVTAMESFGVDEFEFSAYPGCCDDCQDMHGNKYSAGEADEIIPVHCRCRCCLLPVIGSSAVETPLNNFPSSLEEPTMEKSSVFATLAERLAKIAKGSSTSGNYNHEGRPGEVGGSTPSGGSTGGISSAVEEAASALGIDKDMVQFGGMTDKHAGEVSAAIKRFKSEFPGVSVAGIRPMTREEIDSHNKALMVTLAYEKGNLLVYNDETFSTENGVEDSLWKSYSYGWLSGKSVGDLVAHEMGHALTFDKFRSSGDLANTDKVKELDDVKFEFSGGIKSRYGASKGSEGLAEAVSVYVRTGGFDGIKVSGGRPVASVLKEYTGVDFK